MQKGPKVHVHPLSMQWNKYYCSYIPVSYMHIGGLLQKGKETNLYLENFSILAIGC